MNKKFVKKIGFLILETVLLSVVVFSALVSFEFFSQKRDQKSQFQEFSLYENDQENGLIKVLGDTTVLGTETSGAQFIAQDIVLGAGAMVNVSDDDRDRQIEIFNFQGKLFFSNEEENKISYYISWHSNKPIFSTIEYKSDKDSEYQKISEDKYSYVHTFTLPDIDFSSVYKYKIISKDRWGSQIESNEFVFYTGPPEESFFELLEQSFVDIFGWTVGVE